MAQDEGQSPLHLILQFLCQTQGPPAQRRAPLHNSNVRLSIECVTINIVGPFPEIPRGNKYILVTTDCFTKFMEVFLIPSQEATSVANAVVTGLFTKYGTPTYLHSDKGTKQMAEQMEHPPPLHNYGIPGLTPSFLMFSLETAMPIDPMVRLPPDHNRVCTAPTEGVYREARQHLKQAVKRQRQPMTTE